MRGLLAPPADALEAAHLRRPPPPGRRLARVTPARADDPLRGARIGRRHHARRRGTDRVGRDGWRRRAWAKRRDIPRVADTAGVGQRPRIGRAERHARYRRITGAGRTGWRRQLCEGLGGRDQGERHDENKRRIAGHRGQSLQKALIQRSCGVRVPLPPGGPASSRRHFLPSVMLRSRRRRENQT